jgi:hypothetical protein
MPTPNDAAAAAKPRNLEPNDLYYMVLEPTNVLNQDGTHGYNMWGPIPDFGNAATLALSKPGSLIALTVILDRAKMTAAAAKIQPFKPL